MASVAIRVVGTVLNAVAFIGRNYLTHLLFGDDAKSALEAYPAAYAKNKKERMKLLEQKQRTGKTKLH